jgi:hypothetical protein
MESCELWALGPVEVTRVFGGTRQAKKKTTADLCGMTTKKGKYPKDRRDLRKEDRPAGPYIEALVNPS